MASLNKKDVVLKVEDMDFCDFYNNKNKEKPSYFTLFKYKSIRNNTTFATLLRFMMMFGKLFLFYKGKYL